MIYANEEIDELRSVKSCLEANKLLDSGWRLLSISDDEKTFTLGVSHAYRGLLELFHELDKKCED